MTDPLPRIQPQAYARAGGLLYLFIIVAAGFGELVARGSLLVPHDALATARNITASETLFRAGLAAELLTCACDVTLAMILYALLAPVSRYLALLGAFFRLTFVAVYGVTKLFEIMALEVLGRRADLGAFDPGQLDALAYLSLRVHGLGYGASLLLFGCCCVVFGFLIRRSGYLPRILGTLLAAGGIGYVAFSLAQLLSPAFAARWLFPWLMLPAFVAELALGLWLLVRGVDVQAWAGRTRQ
jgi:hypothetical protein